MEYISTRILHKEIFPLEYKSLTVGNCQAQEENSLKSIFYNPDKKGLFFLFVEYKFEKKEAKSMKNFFVILFTISLILILSISLAILPGCGDDINSLANLLTPTANPNPTPNSTPAPAFDIISFEKGGLSDLGGKMEFDGDQLKWTFDRPLSNVVEESDIDITEDDRLVRSDGAEYDNEGGISKLWWTPTVRSGEATYKITQFGPFGEEDGVEGWVTITIRYK